MSYILDAIKKAEDQRLQDHVPTLESSVALKSIPPRRRQGFRIWLMILLLLSLAVAAWLNQSMVKQGLAEIRTMIARAAELWSTNVSPKDPVETPQTQLAPVNSPEVEEDDQPVALIIQESEPATQEPAEQAIVQNSAISALDYQRLKQITISVISYSIDDNRRFIMQGSRILREGDLIQDYGIREIRRNSVILDVGSVTYEIKL